VATCKKIQRGKYNFRWTEGVTRRRSRVECSEAESKRLLKDFKLLEWKFKVGLLEQPKELKLDTLLKEYDRYRQGKNLSKASYEHDKKALDLLVECPDKDFSGFLYGKGYAPATCNMRIRHAKTFVLWVKRTKDYDLKYNLEKVKEADTLPRCITVTEKEAIWKEADPRLIPFFNVYYKLGLRMAEFKSMKLQEKSVIVTGKGRERILPYFDDVKNDVLECYPTQDNASESQSRVTGGTIFTLDWVERSFSKCARKVGSKATLHSLRHTFALRKYIESKDIKRVSLLLGHSNLSTTEIYTKFPPEIWEEYLSLS